MRKTYYDWLECNLDKLERGFSRAKGKPNTGHYEWTDYIIDKWTAYCADCGDSEQQRGIDYSKEADFNF